MQNVKAFTVLFQGTDRAGAFIILVRTAFDAFIILIPAAFGAFIEGPMSSPSLL